MPVIETRPLSYFDNQRQYRQVLQSWVEIPGTGVWIIVAVQPVEIDPNLAPVCPTRPV